MQSNVFNIAKNIFLQHAGILRASEAIKEGVHPRTLYAMRDAGIVESLCRGLYRLTDLSPLSNPDLVSVALKVPNGVVCLISALAYHEITTQIPHEVYLAIERGSMTPRMDYPPLSVHRFTDKAFSAGIEVHQVDGVSVRIYSPEKTIADCFKYRNKMGMDTVIEALKLYQRKFGINIDKLMYFANICRVEKIIRPYLEMLL